MEPLTFDPNDPDIQRFARAQQARRPVVDSADPYVRRVVDASRARARAAAAPVAASIPATDNIAPVATSAAASRPGFGSRLMSGGRALAKGFGGAYIVGTGAAATAESLANDPAQGTTEAEAVARGSATREAMKAALPFGVGQLVDKVIPEGNTGDLGRASERAVGFVKNLFGSAAAPVTSMVVDQRGEPAPAAPVVAAPGDVAQPQPAPSADDPGYMPGLPRYRGVAGVKLPDKPTLSQEGGIFGALANYHGQLMNYSLATAERNQRQKAELGVGRLNNDAQATFEKANAEADQRRLDEKKLTAAAQSKALKDTIDASVKGKEVVQDALGNVVLVDKAKGTAQKITPTETPSYQQFKDAAAKDPRNKGATEEDFKRAYSRDYGTK